MKASVKLFCCLLLGFLCSLGGKAQEQIKSAPNLSGTWDYAAPEAPSGYEKGTITFVKEGNRLKGKVLIQGTEYKTSEIKSQGENTYATDLEVDGYPVQVSLKLEPKVIIGVAVGGGMNIPVTLTKAKK